MALLQGYNIKFVLAVLLLTVQVTLSAKTNASPVYEVINEQSKAEERLIKTSAVVSLPYGNPLAGNSQQNAKLHAYNQQAMFNAERVRQHKAQSQRWMKTPQLVNNDMHAYHESQENHQLVLEQQQANLNDDIPKPTQRTREPSKRPLKDQSDTTSPKAVKPERKRNHRSHGSVEYQTVYVPSTMNNQGLKPDIINEMAYTATAKLYNHASPNTESVYLQYYPAQDYQSVQDIETLNSLLNKNPGDQLTGFNALINSPKVNTINHDKELEAPIDLYFHLKGPSKFPLPEHYDDTRYAQIPTVQETHTKEYTPIKEEEEEENITEAQEMRQYKVQSILEQPTYTNVPATKNIQYINSELTNQILSAGYNPLYQEERYKIREEEKPTYQALQYGNRPAFHDHNGHKSDGDLSIRYLHHNAHKGIQHLAQDGSGVSAYDDGNVSIFIDAIHQNRFLSNQHSIRRKRSVLDTSPFLLYNENITEPETFEDSIPTNSTQIPKQEPLIRMNLNPKRKREDFGTFLTTPNFPIGEAIDYSDNSYEELPQILKRPNRNYDIPEYDDQDYNYDDFPPVDYNFETQHNKQPVLIPRQNQYAPIEMYAPSETYTHTVDLKGNYGKARPLKRFPAISTTIGPIYSSNNLAISSPSYGIHQNYGIPTYSSQTKFSLPSVHFPEPVYLITRSQLSKLVGHHNLNIEHLDVYQLSKEKRNYPRKYKKIPHTNRDLRKNLLKLHKLHLI